MRLSRDKRKYLRQTLSLEGRMLLPNHVEIGCTTLDITPDSLSITAPLLPYRGQRIVAYFNQIGRVEGKVVRVDRTRGSFAISTKMTHRKRAQLAVTVAEIVKGGVAAAWEVSAMPLPEHSAPRPLLDPSLVERAFGEEDSRAKVAMRAVPYPRTLPNVDPMRKYLDFD